MVDFLYGRVVDAGADVVDAVDPRCYNGNRYPRWGPDGANPHTVSTLSPPTLIVPQTKFINLLRRRFALR